jgi:lysyl-tRNA synthetase, class II
LYLKRLLVGGFTKVFELNRNFRNEGISPKHNPEFTMLEAYEAFGSWETMADLVEGMICHIAEKLFGGLKIEHKNAAGEVTRTINLERPWPRVPMHKLVEKALGILFSPEKGISQDAIKAYQDRFRQKLAHDAEASSDPLAAPVAAFARAGMVSDSAAKEIRLDGKTPAERLVEVYEKLVEPTLINPTFVTHIPSVIIPLAKRIPEPGIDPKYWYFADVYELAINGQEISPGYSELNDPDVQAENFAHQVGDEAERQKTDEDFLTALKFGMPPAGGMGMGIDRLVMMLTGAESIRDVILFPLMRPTE